MLSQVELKTGMTVSFISNATGKSVQGKVVKINSKTTILEVQKQRTIIRKIKGFFSQSKEKTTIINETKLIKKRKCLLTA